MVDCPTLISQYLSILQTYDTDRNGKIEQSEANQANLDYFAGKITKDQSIAVINAYNLGCTFTPAPVPYREAQLISCSAPPTAQIGQSITVALTISQGSNTENYKAVFSGSYTGESAVFSVPAGTGQVTQNVSNITFSSAGTNNTSITLIKV